MIVLSPLPGAAQQILQVSGTPCAECTIDRRLVFRVAGRDQSLVGQYTVVARDSRGRWLLGTMDRTPGVVAVYGADGALLTQFSRQGDGPGEHRGVHAMAVTRGDTVHLFDNYLRRHSVFSPSYQFIRSTTLDGQVFGAIGLAQGEVIVNADIPTPNRVGFPLHQLAPDGRILRSFGVEVPSYRSDNLYHLIRAFAPGTGGQVWAAPRLRYEPSLWSVAGKIVEVQRAAPWFPAQVVVRPPGKDRPPSPWISGLWYDTDEHLWMLIHVADARWRPTPPPATPQSEMVPQFVWDREFDTVVEVINVRTGVVVASQRFGELFTSLLPGGFVVHHREDPEGETFLEVWQLSIPTLTRR